MSAWKDLITKGAVLDLRDKLLAEGLSAPTLDGDPILKTFGAFKSDVGFVLMDAGADATGDDWVVEGPRFIRLHRTVEDVQQVLDVWGPPDEEGAQAWIKAAVRHGNVDAVRAILAACPDADHEHLVGYAAAKGAPMLQVLVDAGRTVTGGKPLAVRDAAAKGHVDAVALLLDAEADPTRRGAAWEAGLCEAARYGQRAVLEHLWAALPDGASLPHAVAGEAQWYGHLDLLELLAEWGEDVAGWSDPDSGLTLLHRAVACGQGDIVAWLIEQGANVNAQTKTRVTPLAMACRVDNADMARRLLAAGADVRARDGYGNSLVGSALQRFRPELDKRGVQRAWSGSAKELVLPAITDWNAWSHWAKWRPRAALVRLLVEAGAPLERPAKGHAHAADLAVAGKEPGWAPELRGGRPPLPGALRSELTAPATRKKANEALWEWVQAGGLPDVDVLRAAIAGLRAQKYGNGDMRKRLEKVLEATQYLESGLRQVALEALQALVFRSHGHELDFLDHVRPALDDNLQGAEAAVVALSWIPWVLDQIPDLHGTDREAADARKAWVHTAVSLLRSAQRLGGDAIADDALEMLFLRDGVLLRDGERATLGGQPNSKEVIVRALQVEPRWKVVERLVAIAATHLAALPAEIVLGLKSHPGNDLGCLAAVEALNWLRRISAEAGDVVRQVLRPGPQTERVKRALRGLAVQDKYGLFKAEEWRDDAILRGLLAGTTAWLTDLDDPVNRAAAAHQVRTSRRHGGVDNAVSGFVPQPWPNTWRGAAVTVAAWGRWREGALWTRWMRVIRRAKGAPSIEDFVQPDASGAPVERVQVAQAKERRRFCIGADRWGSRYFVVAGCTLDGRAPVWRVPAGRSTLALFAPGIPEALVHLAGLDTLLTDDAPDDATPMPGAGWPTLPTLDPDALVWADGDELLDQTEEGPKQAGRARTEGTTDWAALAARLGSAARKLDPARKGWSDAQIAEVEEQLGGRYPEAWRHVLRAAGTVVSWDDAGVPIDGQRVSFEPGDTVDSQLESATAPTFRKTGRVVIAYLIGSGHTLAMPAQEDATDVFFHENNSSEWKRWGSLHKLVTQAADRMVLAAEVRAQAAPQGERASAADVAAAGFLLGRLDRPLAERRVAATRLFDAMDALDRDGPWRLLATAADDAARSAVERWRLVALLADSARGQAMQPPLRRRLLETCNEDTVSVGALSLMLRILAEDALEAAPLEQAKLSARALAELLERGWVTRAGERVVAGAPAAPSFSLVAVSDVAALSGSLAPLSLAGPRTLGDAWYDIADKHLSAKDYAAAEAALGHAAALRPAHVNTWFRLGNARRLQQNTDGAVAAYRRTVQLMPTAWNAWMWMGKTLRLAGRAGDGLPALQEAVKVGDRKSLAWEELAHGQKAVGDGAGALQSIEKAWELAPGERIAQYRGRFLKDEGRVADAIAFLTPVIEQHPDWASATVDLGLLHYGTGGYDRAVELYTQALEHRPGHANTLLNRACSRCLAGDRDGALDDLRATLAAEPGRAQAIRTDDDLASLRDDPDFLALFE